MSEEKKIDYTEHSKLAKDILKIIATSDIQLGERDIQNEPVQYKETVMRVIELLYRKNTPMLELELVFQLARQAIGIMQNATVGSIELSKNMALTNFWGKHPDEITMQDIDVKMKKDK